MNPLRSLAQFIAFLHSQRWTNKTGGMYQVLHFATLLGLFFAACGIYLTYFGFSLPVNEITAVMLLIPSVLLGSIYLLFFGKRPYLKAEYKNWELVYGGIIWLLLWMYIVPSILLLKN